MISSCVSFPRPTHNISLAKHPNVLVSSISCSFPESRECNKFSSNILQNNHLTSHCESSSKISAAINVHFATEGNPADRLAQKVLPGGLQPELMPKHVALIMDGNRRWAAKKGLSVEDAHRAGGATLHKMTRLSGELGVKVLTVFAFSTENWVRPKEEVDFLMRLFEGEAQSVLDLAME